jgi:hypothetical protein
MLVGKLDGPFPDGARGQVVGHLQGEAISAFREAREFERSAGRRRDAFLSVTEQVDFRFDGMLSVGRLAVEPAFHHLDRPEDARPFRRRRERGEERGGLAGAVEFDRPAAQRHRPPSVGGPEREHEGTASPA